MRRVPLFGVVMAAACTIPVGSVAAERPDPPADPTPPVRDVRSDSTPPVRDVRPERDVAPVRDVRSDSTPPVHDVRPERDVAPVRDVRPERDVPFGDRIEHLRLRCAVRPTDVAPVGTAVVRCEWSSPPAPPAAAVRLIRFEPTADPARRVVFRSGDPAVGSYTDTEVRRGHTYGYVVQGLSADGRVVARSEIVRVRIPAPADVAVMRLACRLGPAAETIGCEWSLPDVRGVAVVTLWRSVDGGPREVVERFRPDGPTAYRDPVPAGAARVVYAVVATTEDARVVARSRPEGVALRDRAWARTGVRRL